MRPLRRRHHRRAAVIGLALTLVSAPAFAAAPSAAQASALDLTVAVDAASIAPAGPAVTAEVRNLERKPSRAVVVEFALPESLSLAEGSACSGGRTVVCPVGDIPGGGIGTVSFTTMASGFGEAAISATAFSGSTTSAPADAAAATTRVYGRPTVDIVDAPDPTSSTGVLTFAVTVTNPNDVVFPPGGATAQIDGWSGMYHHDYSRFGYVAATTNAGTCTIPEPPGSVAESDTWRCDFTLPPGETTIDAAAVLENVAFTSQLRSGAVVSAECSFRGCGWYLGGAGELTSILPNCHRFGTCEMPALPGT